MLIKLQERKVRQHLVPHSRSVWSPEETTVTEHTFYWCWGSRCAEDPLEEAVQDGELRLMLHSFPGVWVSRETAGLLTNKSDIVPHDCWYRNMASSRLFTRLGSKPKTRTENKFLKAKAKDLASKAEAKAKDLTFEAKAKDIIGWPWGASRPRTCPRGLQLWQIIYFNSQGIYPYWTKTGVEGSIVYMAPNFLVIYSNVKSGIQGNTSNSSHVS